MEQSELERHEAKYVIPPSLVPDIREFVRAFCVPDPNAEGPIPEYTLTTLQLDSPDLALYRATRDELVNRFKLRARVYGTEPGAPVYCEVKRRAKGIVLKSRCKIPHDFWGPELFATRRTRVPPFRSNRERLHFAEFTRLVSMLEARPVVLVRYIRESYMGANDLYARVTFDRRLCYSPTRSWDLPPDGVRWRAMDTTTALERPFSGLILELKTYRDTPLWMVELTQRFNLVRTGFCKYARAIRMEAIYEGRMGSGTFETPEYSLLGV